MAIGMQKIRFFIETNPVCENNDLVRGGGGGRGGHCRMWLVRKEHPCDQEKETGMKKKKSLPRLQERIVPGRSRSFEEKSGGSDKGLKNGRTAPTR